MEQELLDKPPKYCPECHRKGIKAKVKKIKISSGEKILLCRTDECPWPRTQEELCNLLEGERSSQLLGSPVATSTPVPVGRKRKRSKRSKVEEDLDPGSPHGSEDVTVLWSEESSKKTRRKEGLSGGKPSNEDGKGIRNYEGEKETIKMIEVSGVEESSRKNNNEDKAEKKEVILEVLKESESKLKIYGSRRVRGHYKLKKMDQKKIEKAKSSLQNREEIIDLELPDNFNLDDNAFNKEKTKRTYGELRLKSRKLKEVISILPAVPVGDRGQVIDCSPPVRAASETSEVRTSTAVGGKVHPKTPEGEVLLDLSLAGRERAMEDRPLVGGEENKEKIRITKRKVIDSPKTKAAEVSTEQIDKGTDENQGTTDGGGSSIQSSEISPEVDKNLNRKKGEVANSEEKSQRNLPKESSVVTIPEEDLRKEIEGYQQELDLMEPINNNQSLLDANFLESIFNYNL